MLLDRESLQLPRNNVFPYDFFTTEELEAHADLLGRIPTGIPLLLSLPIACKKLRICAHYVQHDDFTVLVLQSIFHYNSTPLSCAKHYGSTEDSSSSVALYAMTSCSSSIRTLDFLEFL